MRGATRWIRSSSASQCDFNSHAPCGARRVAACHDAVPMSFQLTRPMRGATSSFLRPFRYSTFQLTRPMQGATGASEEDFAEAIDFNSHAPCGARRVGCRICTHFTDFNSHAPCGARQSSYSLIQGITYFNSHAPCGARLDAGGPHGPPAIFQLTRPMRGAT